MSGTSRSLAFVLALVLIGFMAGSAMAAGVAQSTDSITNGVFTGGDTVPQAKGRVSVLYKKSSTLADSNSKGCTGAAQISVDTGYDMDTIGFGVNGYPADKSGGIGDTVSFAYWIRNTSNATIRIYFDSAGHPSSQGDSGPASAASTNWNMTGSYKVYTDSNNDGVWNTGDTIIGAYQGASNFIQLAAGASDTVVLVVVIPTDANSGETTTSFVLVTDRAPIGNGSTTGDGWQDSVPVTNDNRDTQYDTTVTTVSGPNVLVDKAMYEETAGRSRPGDTLIINITFDNDGTDSARGVQIMDAIPNFTRYIRNSADSGSFVTVGAAGNVGQTAAAYGDSDITVEFDTDAPGTTLDFKDTEATCSDTASSTAGVNQTVKVIRWTMEYVVGENNGDASGTVNYNDGVYDNGRVAYRVHID